MGWVIGKKKKNVSGIPQYRDGIERTHPASTLGKEGHTLQTLKWSKESYLTGQKTPKIGSARKGTIWNIYSYFAKNDFTYIHGSSTSFFDNFSWSCCHFLSYNFSQDMSETWRDLIRVDRVVVLYWLAATGPWLVGLAHPTNQFRYDDRIWCKNTPTCIWKLM